jgi:hypothetical protein
MLKLICGGLVKFLLSPVELRIDENCVMVGYYKLLFHEQ